MEYFRIYLDLMEEELRYEFGYSDGHVKTAISRLQKEYDKVTLAQHQSTVNYDDSLFRCAYLYQYASCHSNMIEYFASDIFENCRLVFNNLFSTKYLRITCLGGGPGIDAIAFLRAASRKFRLFDFTSVHITVIDLCGGWEGTMHRLLEKSKWYPEFFGTFPFHSTCSFLEADLVKPWPSDVLKAIETADIVTMVKFVSAANGCNSGEKVPQLLKKIFFALKPGTLLLFADNAGGGSYDMVNREATDCGRIIQVYGPKLHHLFQMPWNTMKSDCQKHKKRFGTYPLFSTRVSTGLWMKQQNENNFLLSNSFTYVYSPPLHTGYPIKQGWANAVHPTRHTLVNNMCQHIYLPQLLIRLCLQYMKGVPVYSLLHVPSPFGMMHSVTVSLPDGTQFTSFKAATQKEATLDAVSKALDFLKRRVVFTELSVTECPNLSVEKEKYGSDLFAQICLKKIANEKPQVQRETKKVGNVDVTIGNSLSRASVSVKSDSSPQTKLSLHERGTKPEKDIQQLKTFNSEAKRNTNSEHSKMAEHCKGKLVMLKSASRLDSSAVTDKRLMRSTSSQNIDGLEKKLPLLERKISNSLDFQQKELKNSFVLQLCCIS